MITYKWKIQKLEYYTHKNGYDQVVHCIHWVLIGTDEDNHTYATFGAQTLNNIDLDPNKYVAFEDLTEEQVILWLEESLGQDRIRESQNTIETQIHNMINPPNVLADPPWNK